MKIIIAPDSFKSTMSAAAVAGVTAEAICEVLPEAEVIELPVADGGEGTIDAILSATGGKKIPHKVMGPEFTEVDSYYGLLPDGTAVIELAAICGLTMAVHPSPEVTTTFGVGQMIGKALDDGCGKLILCIGGSATNDAGIGAMAALGVKFLDWDGKPVVPNGAGLSQIVAIDTSEMDPRLRSLNVQIACDVDNPLYGEKGAAHVFTPQKGADAAMVSRLDAGLRNYADVLEAFVNHGIANVPGTGAAGGIASSFLAFCGAAIKPGIDIILDTLNFDERIRDADLIITGEGKTDAQTLGGKVVLGVAHRAARQGISVIVISGDVDNGVDELLYAEGVRAVFSTNRLARPFTEVRENCPEWLKATVKNVIRTVICRRD